LWCERGGAPAIRVTLVLNNQVENMAVRHNSLTKRRTCNFNPDGFVLATLKIEDVAQ
jgi:hypothetical protein